MDIFILIFVLGLFGALLSLAFDYYSGFVIFFALAFVSLAALVVSVTPKNPLPRTGEINVIEMSHGFAEKP